MQIIMYGHKHVYYSLLLAGSSTKNIMHRKFSASTFRFSLIWSYWRGLVKYDRSTWEFHLRSYSADAQNLWKPPTRRQ